MLARPQIRLIAVAIGLVFLLREAAGRLAPRAAIAPLVFLVTRWPVLIAWAAGAVGWLLLIVPGMEAKGRNTLSDYATALGIALLCGGGVAVIVVAPIFFLARLFTSAPVLQFLDGETVLLELTANHFIRGESRGGKLFVTSQRLAFRPNRFNVQLATWSLPLTDIERCEVSGQRFVLVHSRNRPEAEWIVTWDSARLANVVKKVMAEPESSRSKLSF